MESDLLTAPLPPLTPRDYQDEAFPALMEWLENNEGNPLIVVPTGGGKSLILAEAIRRCRENYGNMRFLVLSHVYELLLQDGAAISRQCPDLRVTYYSASLKEKNNEGDVVIAGIQSIHRKAHILQSPPPDLIFVDEVHLVPHTGEGMYRRFIDDMLKINPYIRIVGLTATPFRKKGGLLYKGEGALFHGIAHDVNILDLIERGYLSPLVTPTMSTRINLEGVKVRGNEYAASDLQGAADKEHITRACVAEIISHSIGRKRWLVFTAGKKHCAHVCEELRLHGVDARVVTDDTPKGERDAIVAWHKAKTDDVRCIVNVAVFTTGFDSPATDLIALVTSTRSPVLYVQIMGRGMRIADGKEDCVVLDFGGVIDTLGPIDQIRLPKQCKGDNERAAPSKNCPECGEENHAAARVCIACDYEFPAPETKIESEASGAAILSTQLRIESHPVSHMTLYRHQKEGKMDTLRVEYLSGLTKVFKKWMGVEHSGRARSEFVMWWTLHGGGKPPMSIDEALSRKAELKKPIAVMTRKIGKYYEVTGYDHTGNQRDIEPETANAW
jgi:DNA repair protein RadD